MAQVEERGPRHSAWRVTWPWAAGLAALGEVPPALRLVGGHAGPLNPAVALVGLGVGASITFLFWWAVLAGVVWLARAVRKAGR